MANIKNITTGGTTYEVQDTGARTLIAALQGSTNFVGVTTSNISDGSTANPIVVNGDNVTAVVGDIVSKGSTEFIFDGAQWLEFGDKSALGDLAYEDEVEATFRPAGEIDNPNITVTTTTGSVNSVTNVGTLPDLQWPTYTYNADTETLTIGAGSFDAGAKPTIGTVTTASAVSAELADDFEFTGTEATVTSTKATV